MHYHSECYAADYRLKQLGWHRMGPNELHGSYIYSDDKQAGRLRDRTRMGITLQTQVFSSSVRFTVSRCTMTMRKDSHTSSHNLLGGSDETHENFQAGQPISEMRIDTRNSPKRSNSVKHGNAKVGHLQTYLSFCLLT